MPRELMNRDKNQSIRLGTNDNRGSAGKRKQCWEPAYSAGSEKEYVDARRREAKQIKERLRRAGITKTINGIYELKTKIFGFNNLAPDDLHFDNQAELFTCRVVLQHMVKLVKSRPELTNKLRIAREEMKAIARAGYKHNHLRRRLLLMTSPTNVVDQGDKENYLSTQGTVGKDPFPLSLHSIPNHNCSAFKPYQHRPALASIQSTPGRSINSSPISSKLTEDVDVSYYSRSIALCNRYLSIDSGFQSPNDQSSSINGLDLSLKLRMTKNRSTNGIWRPWD